MSSNGFLSNQLSMKTSFFGLKRWVVFGIGVGTLFALILFVLSFWLLFRRKSSKVADKRVLLPSIPNVSKDIQEVKSEKTQDFSSFPEEVSANSDLMGAGPQKAAKVSRNRKILARRGNDSKDYIVQEKRYERNDYNSDPECVIETNSSVDQMKHIVEIQSSGNYENAVIQLRRKESNDSTVTRAEISPLGWGQWYTLSELVAATDNFSEKNIIGEGGYGIVYKGQLLDGTLVAVKNLLNNRGQAEKEFQVEVEAIGKVRHKNLVRLLGYCAEGDYRMLIYEYVGNGNLEHWLHESEPLSHAFSWEARMKIVLGTAKALAYLHEALEPKVVHRDIKSSNILIDSDWTPKVSDFGLAKMLASGQSHLTTRVMGTFGYVAPEYANTGLLNEKSDVYSFGVLLMEVITGRDPVNYGRPPEEVNLVDWLKNMVASRRFSELVDPSLDVKPSSRTLKRSLLIALKCVDQDSTNRPKMGLVAHMLETEDFPFENELKMTQKLERARQSDALNQEKMIQSLSKEIDIESGISPRPFKKKWKRYER